MDKTLLIWKYLLPLLENNDEFKRLVDTKYVYPIMVTDTEAKFPCVVYKRDSLVPQYTKYNPGYYGWTNTISISITVYSDNYNEGLYIINLIRDILENYHEENEEIKIHPLEIVNSTEYYSEGVFSQTLTFSVTAE